MTLKIEFGGRGTPPHHRDFDKKIAIFDVFPVSQIQSCENNPLISICPDPPGGVFGHISNNDGFLTSLGYECFITSLKTLKGKREPKDIKIIDFIIFIKIMFFI